MIDTRDGQRIAIASLTPVSVSTSFSHRSRYWYSSFVPPQLIRLKFPSIGPRSIGKREKCVLHRRCGLMVHQMIDGTYRQTILPNKPSEYLAKREELRLAEVDWLNMRE